MLNIHLFGELRKFSSNKKSTDDSVIHLEYITDESVTDLLIRIGIFTDIGEVFVNHKVVTLDSIIERDESRVAIFPGGMVLLCGGQHLKGHGYRPHNRQTSYFHHKLRFLFSIHE